MNVRISKSLVAAALALPLLAGCGASTEASPAASSAPASTAASSSAPAASASPEPTTETQPSDATDDVKAATENFFEQVFTLKYSDSAEDYGARIKPLVTPELYKTLTDEVDIEKSLKTARARFGADARARSEVVGKVKVDKLSLTEATTTAKWVTKIQKPDGKKWKTVKESVDETSTISLVKKGDAWLVDDAK